MTQINGPKKLKKVDEIQNVLELNQANLMKAYKEKNGVEIDKASKVLFEYLNTLGMKEDSSYYVEMKNHTWQRNHLKVLASISTLIQTNGRMPATTEIAVNCGLSEETIYKHLKEFKTHELYNHELEKFKLMELKILASLFTYAVQGDVRACKVYLDYFKPSNEIQQSNYQQNNFIQFNSLKLSFEDLSNLPNDVKSKMEKIILNPTYFETNEIVL